MKNQRNLFIPLTIMCAAFVGAFTFDSTNVYWMWEGKEPAAIILAVSSVLCGIGWFFSKKGPKGVHS